MQFIKHSVLFFLFALLPLLVGAQTEAEMKAQADKLFDSEQYLEATPLYMRLLSLKPRELDYNYKYGTCLLFNSNRKQEAIRYLSYSVNDPAVVPEAYYFLGRALHLNYQFNEAIKNYQAYLEKRTGTGKMYDAERDIQMCQNGKRLMTTISDIIVLDKKEITIDKFFRIYELKDIGGSLLVTAEFQTKIDKKNNHIPLIHFPQNPSVIYYSSYGENGANGKDIFVRRKLPDGSWGLPQPIPGNVNSKFDEDFPYMHPDGNYLYFSSKGHNSMGGYDVFRSKYDPENNSFGPPENMDFAISSPDDDLFYVVDSLNKDAFFASARQSEKGKVYVYKVKVDRVPIQLVVIKGNFVSEVDPNIKKINFEIRDFANGDVIGKFNSNEKAVYLITFPKGGKYEYVMTIEGSDQEFRSVVSLPFMKEFKPLKQKIIHTMEEGREVVKIINLFNEEVEDPQAVIAEVIKMRSELNVNVNEFDMEQLEKEKESKEILNELGLGDLLLVEVSDVLQQQVKKTKDGKNLVNSIDNNINTIVVENSADFIRLEEQIKNKVAEANKVQNTESKYILLKEAEAMIKKQEELKKYSKSLLRLNDSIKGVVAGSTISNDQQKIEQISKEFDQLYKEGKETEALQLLAGNKELILKVLNDNSTDFVQNLVDKVVKLDEEISVQKAKVDGYDRELKDLEIEIGSLKNSIYSAKKKDVPAIEAKIAQKQEEMKLIEEERTAVQKVIDQKAIEKSQLNKQISVLQDAISNRSIASVSKEQANKALAETEKTNSNTLTAYVSQQIAELEKQDPSLKDRIVVSSGLKAQNIYEEFRSSERGIQDDPALSKEDKLYKLLSNERQAIRQLDLRLAEIEELQVENKFDENLNREKQALLSYKKEIEAQIGAHEKQVEALVAKDGIADKGKVIESIDPEYEKNRSYIESNNNLTSEEKALALNKEDEKLLNSVEAELKKVDSQLIKTPNDKALLTKQETLNKIKTDTERSITERNKETASQADLALTQEQLIEQVASGYSGRVAVINANTALSSKEKLTALNKEDQQLLAAINAELKKVESQLQKDPNNEGLKAKKEKLQQIKSETEAAIDQRNKELSGSEVSTTGPTTEELITKVNPGYSERKTAIENNSGLSEKARVEQLNAEDQKLITAIDKELKQVTADLKKDPTNAVLKSRQEKLQQIKSETETAIEQRNKVLASGQDTVAGTSKETVIEQLDPDYEDTKSSITTNNTLSKEEQVEQLNNADRALISKIDDRLNQIEEKLENDPSDITLQSEKQILTSIKTEKESAISEREKELSSTQPSDLSAETTKLIETIDPGYSKEIAAINNNEQLTPEEKLSQTQQRDQELLKSVDTKLTSVEKQLAKDTENKDLIQQKQDLTVLKSETEARISEREQLIDSKLASELTAENISEQKSILKAKLDPSFEKKITAARATEGTELDKKSAELKVEQQLLDKINTEETAIRKILSKDPMNKEIKVRYMVLNDLKKETQKNIDLLNSDITALKDGQPLVTVTAEDKTAKIAALAPAYTSIIEAVQSADIPKEEKASQLLEEEKSLLNVAEARLEAARTELKADPSNRELQKEVKVLEEIVAESKQRIEGHERTISEASQLPELSQTQKDQLIDQVDPQYEEKVRSIEVDQTLSETEKLKQRQTTDQELLGQIYDRQEKIDDQLTDDPSSKELKEEQRSLTVVANELEKQISERQEDIARKETVTATVSEAEKDEMITQVDPAYANDVAVIAQLDLSEEERLKKLQLEDRSLLEKIERAIGEKEDALNNDATNTTLKKELEILKAVRSDLQTAIERRDEQLKGTSTDIVQVNEEQRTEKIAALDKSYEDTRGSIENNADLTDTKKAEELLAIDNQMLGKVTDEKIRIKEELAKDPQNTTLKKELAITEAAELEMEERVQRDKDAIKSSEQPSDLAAVRTKVITDVLPDYTTRKDAIENSGETEQKKTEDLIKLETELLTKLQAEEKTVKKALAKDPENAELKQRHTAVQELIAMQQNQINGLKDQQTTLAVEAKKETLVKETDATYTADIERLKQSTSETKNSDLAEREAVHQERVSEQIEENEKTLAKKEDPKLKAETEILKTELTDSKQREEEFRKGTTTAPVDQEAKERFVADLREDLLQGKTGEVTAEYSTVEELKQQDQVLAQYESELKKEIASQEKIVAQDPQNANEQAQLNYLKDELKTVQEKRRSVKITLGELEKIAVVEDRASDERFNDPELKQLGAEETKIEEQLNDPNLSKKERAVLESQLESVQEKKTTKENALLSEELKTQEQETKSLTSELKSTASVNEETQLNSRAAIAQQQSLDMKAEQLKKEAAETKNPEEKNYLLDQAVSTQERSNDVAKEAVIENRVQQLEEQNGIESLETKSQLEQKKRRYSIQIGELTKVIQELDEQITLTKGKEAEALKAERQAKVDERALIQKQLDTVNEQIAQQDAKRMEVKPTTDPEAMKQEVSYQEEQEIASSEHYKDYSEKANAALQVEKQIATLEAQLNTERTETKKLVAAELDDPSEVNKARVQENVQRVKQMETELQTLKSELATKQEIAQQALPANTDEAMKMQNLVKRGVEPIQRLAIAAALVPLPASGLEINTNATAPNNMIAAIPVNVKNPTGLVYRVQVGAFAKPIPQDLFKEFNPVSGEKINENGITRYMAGYFNSSQKVVEARDQIRQLGYADAFAIAYCDGKRITLAEARIMEANGTCLPKGENELVMEMAANTAVTMGLADTNKLPKQVTYTYNQAPGAAKAEPIEKHLGLFFTVQVGVFNKPVNAKTVYNLSPLMTLRLPNGQIRYSAGIFNSIDEARPKKQEAIDRGVKDAFITAYYNGQRITLAEAQQLLTEKGAAILDNNINKPASTTNQTSTTQQTGQETSETIEPVVEVKKERVQIVTKKTFEEFPREVLNRYNSHGSFYYDETDKRVKSAIAESKDELPQVFYFKDDVDTLVIADDLVLPSNVISVNFTSTSLPGDFIDWLLRYNYRREFKQSEETIELRIHNVPDEKLPELEVKLEQFGLSWKKEE